MANVNVDVELLGWLQEFGNQGILATDAALNVRGWNRWLEVHSGRSRHEMVGRNLLEAYPELSNRHLDSYFHQALKGEPAVLAHRLHRYLLPMQSAAENGFAVMQQSARIAPLLDGDQIIGTITVIEDVTERVVREDELRHARDELEKRVAQRTAELAAAHQQLQHLSRRLIEVQENERRAIARELHDEAGQALTVLMLGLGFIEREAQASPVILARARELKQTTNSVIEGLHRLAVDLRPPSLDRLGLVPALEQYMETLQRQAGLQVDLATVGLDDRRLPAEIEVTLYRVIQEALTNVARHAHARNVGVILQLQGGSAVAIVEDDGVGFDAAAKRNEGRLGLLGMHERIETLGGTLSVESSEGKGTTVYAEIPI